MDWLLSLKALSLKGGKGRRGEEVAAAAKGYKKRIKKQDGDRDSKRIRPNSSDFSSLQQRNLHLAKAESLHDDDCDSDSRVSQYSWGAFDDRRRGT